MKNVFFVSSAIGFAMFVLLVMPGQMLAQSGSTSSSGDIANFIDEQKLDQVEGTLKSTAQELINNPLSTGLAKKALELAKKLKQATSNLPPQGCNSAYNASVQRLDKGITQLEKKECSTNQRLAYRGKCAKFLNDPVKFQKCESEEHGHKPKKPHKPKASYLIATEMERGKCAKFLNDPVKFQKCESEEHGSKPPTIHLPKPKCIAQSTLDPILSQLKSALETLKSLKQNDKDGNGIPDFCDNNKKIK